MTAAGDDERAQGEVADAFDQKARRYDGWYDGPVGRAAFAEELDALRPLLDGLEHPWLEVGVGGGRFASTLGAEVGIDPAREPLALAAARGTRVAVACGEELPFADGTFGAVLFVTSLCFVEDPIQTLREAKRVLMPGGGIVLGLIPGMGPWGRHYRALAEQGNPYYRRARFLDRSGLGIVLAAAGLRPARERSALFWHPGDEPGVADVREGDDLEAGFAAYLLRPARIALSLPEP